MWLDQRQLDEPSYRGRECSAWTNQLKQTKNKNYHPDFYLQQIQLIDIVNVRMPCESLMRRNGNVTKREIQNRCMLTNEIKLIRKKSVLVTVEYLQNKAPSAQEGQHGAKMFWLQPDEHNR